METLLVGKALPRSADSFLCFHSVSRTLVNPQQEGGKQGWHLSRGWTLGLKPRCACDVLQVFVFFLKSWAENLWFLTFKNKSLKTLQNSLCFLQTPLSVEIPACFHRLQGDFFFSQLLHRYLTAAREHFFCFKPACPKMPTWVNVQPSLNIWVPPGPQQAG